MQNDRTVELVLCHHGVLGMKWGVRRYQNKDGSLTAAGKKRVAKLDAERDKIDAERKQLTGKKKSATKAKSTTESKKRTLDDLSDDELKKVTNRMLLKKQYVENQKQYIENSATLAKMEKDARTSKGKKFMQRIGKDVIVPALTNAARQQVQEYLNRQFNKLLNSNKKSQ